MNEQDLEAFEKWWKETGKPYPEYAWQAALEYERERSKKLVEALEYYEKSCHHSDTHESFWTKGIRIITNVRAKEALKEYRGEK